MRDKAELFHMYDYTFNSADTNYGGYRDNPYKHFIRKIGSNGGATDALELLWQISPNYQEPDTTMLAWNPNTTYRFREEWEPDGSGNSVLRTYRDGILLRTTTVPGTWTPTGHSVRIGAANPPGTRSAPVDAVFSNLKVWDFAVSKPPVLLLDFDSTRGLVADALEFVNSWSVAVGGVSAAPWNSEAGRRPLAVDGVFASRQAGILFDGSNDLLTFFDALLPSGTSPFTIAAVIRIPAYATGEPPLRPTWFAWANDGLVDGHFFNEAAIGVDRQFGGGDEYSWPRWEC